MVACISAWVPVPITPSVASFDTGFRLAARAPAAAVRTLVSQHSSWRMASGRPVSVAIMTIMPPAPGRPRAAFRYDPDAILTAAYGRPLQMADLT